MRIPALLLAALQLAWAFTWGVQESLAQVVRVPATGAQTAGVSASAAGARASLSDALPLSQASLALSIAPGLQPVPAPAPAAPLHILITGPPGAGKTTFGKLLARDYGMIHISIGELLRARAAADPELRAAMERGELVDSEIVREIVLERLSRPDVITRGFILDGFPRRPEEIGVIESWIKKGGAIDALVNLTTPDAELRRRILARGRMDDSPEVFRRRMEIYREQTKPVLEHFRATLRVLEAEAGSPDVEVNYAGVRALIERLLAEP